MICELCFTSGDNFIDIISEENDELKIGQILFKYFRFCFEKQPDHGAVCRECWLKVEIFHEFYEHIKQIHSSLCGDEEMFVKNLNISIKVKLENDNKNSLKIPDDIGLSVSLEHVSIETKSESNLSSDSSNDSKGRNKTDIDKQNENPDNDQKPTNRHKIPSEKIRRSKIRERRNAPLKATVTSSGLKCDTCGLIFLTKDTCRRHIKQIHMLHEFVCEEHRCVESFPTKEKLDEHKKHEHTRKTCPHCDKLVPDLNLAFHIKRYHDEDEWIICDLCGKVSTNKHMYKKHYEKEHTQVEKEEEKVQCDVCGKWLKNKESLRSHMRLHIQKPGVCKICGKISPNQKALAQHIRYHSEKYRKKFKCIQCEKGFEDKYKLRMHSYTHSDEAHCCEKCGNSFRSRASRSAHQRRCISSV